MFSDTFEFEELPMKVLGNWVGFFDGTAEIGSNGDVLSICLNTHDKASVWLHADVKSEQDQDLFSNLAASLRELRSETILDIIRSLRSAPRIYAADMDAAIRRAS